LHFAAQLDGERAWQSQAIVAFEDMSDAALERAFGRRFVEVSSITRRHRKGVA
jgi:hypothetical protein